MALDFPASPSNGQIFSSGGISWTFDGEKWKISSSGIEPVFISSSTPTGVAGQIYWDSDESTAYIYYDDGNTAQWVPLVSTAPVSFDTSAIVSGTLPVSRGGTGTTSFDAGKIAEGNTEAEVVDTGSDGHLKVTTEGTERVRVGPAGQIGLGGVNYGTDGQCLTSTGTTTAPEWRTPPLSNRNLVINGAMQIDQRGTSTGVDTTGYYAVDRMRISQNSIANARYTREQSTDAPDGFASSLKVTTTTAEGSVGATDGYRPLHYKIEGQDLQQLQYGTSGAKSLTLSFYVKSSVTGTYGVTFKGIESQERMITDTYTISSANTWEFKSITIPGDTGSSITNDNANRFEIYWIGGSGSDERTQDTSGSWGNSAIAGFAFGHSSSVQLQNTLNSTWLITGVQLEVGEKATPFEHRSFGDELARCQRYFIRYTADNDDCYGFGAIALSASVADFNVTFPCSMRATPSFNFSGAHRVIASTDSANFSSNLNIARQNTDSKSAVLEVTGTNSMVGGQAGGLQARADGAYVEFISEL